MKPKKNKSDPSVFKDFDDLINEINNEYQNTLEWKGKIKNKALELVSYNLGEEDEICIKISIFEIQNLEDNVLFKKLIEAARDKYSKKDRTIFFEENEKVFGEAKDKNSTKDTKNILERVRSSWSEYQGEKTWYEANTKAKELGMRLPTLAELETAYDYEVTKSWKADGINYWTSKEVSASESEAYYFNIDNGKSFQGLTKIKYHVRCIRS